MIRRRSKHVGVLVKCMWKCIVILLRMLFLFNIQFLILARLSVLLKLSTLKIGHSERHDTSIMKRPLLPSRLLATPTGCSAGSPQSLPRVRARTFPAKPCAIHQQPVQTGSWIGEDPKESVCSPIDAHPGDHEALNKDRRWPGLERGTSSLERYLSEHIWTVSKSVHVCTKTPPLCSSLNNLQYSVSFNTALR